MQGQEEVIMIKGKRSKRQRQPSPLTLTIATTSSTTAELSGGGAATSDFSGNSDRVTPSDSNSGELTQDEEEEDMAKCLILLATQKPPPPSPSAAAVQAAPVDVYHCKTCNKSFNSFQALGGHRASHKIKPNKQPLTTLEQKIKLPSNPNYDSTILSLEISRRVSGNPKNKSRVHECSICGAEFASGQALGGHMRRHRPMPAAAVTSSHSESHEAKRPRSFVPLDLNLPAPDDDDDQDQMESEFTNFARKEQIIIFSGSSNLIDCHY
ncbi:hypothetical protein BUALT_Bualt11G0106600 [Buddleja alternifolia]|uniref:C2H2-type domain-containing protein n=1 Tax=Buddleja alternifolia TaxID=168488 RepID=A0AAV6WV31_9LAMI|nr:hypothetical protein BUALT_Bualt11G0106600 [Buddleja alternifolia]